MHFFVRDRFFLAGNIDLTPIGLILHELSKLRNRADYELTSTSFAHPAKAHDAMNKATDALRQLDALEADAARLAAAVAAIRARFP